MVSNMKKNKNEMNELIKNNSKEIVSPVKSEYKTNNKSILSTQTDSLT